MYERDERERENKKNKIEVVSDMQRGRSVGSGRVG